MIKEYSFILIRLWVFFLGLIYIGIVKSLLNLEGWVICMVCVGDYINSFIIWYIDVIVNGFFDE